MEAEDLLPCPCSKAEGLPYHPAEVILKALNVILPELITPLHLNDQQPINARTGPMDGADRHEQAGAGMRRDAVIPTGELPGAGHHHPVFAPVVVPLEADAAIGRDPETLDAVAAGGPIGRW